MTCGLSICRDCTALGHTSNNGHSVISITEKETTYLQEFNDGRKSLDLDERNLQLIESEMALLGVANDTAVTDIENLIEFAQEQLQQHKLNLKKQLSDQFDTQQSALLDKKEQITERVEKLKDMFNQAKDITKTGELSKLKSICETQREVNEKSRSISSKLDLGENYMAFDSNKGLDKFRESLCALGQIHSKGYLPSMFELRNTETTAGLQAILGVDIYDHHGDKLAVSSGALSFQVTDATDTELQTDVCTEGSECNLRFTPQMSGLHTVSGMFLGQPVASVQTKILVSSNNPVSKFGYYGHNNGTFHSPWAVAIDNNHCLYITDVGNKRIQKLSSDGKYLKQFSVAVNNEDYTTCDMALDLNNGLIHCTEILIENNTLQKGRNLLVFNLEGRLLYTYSLSKVWNPYNIAINREGNIILSDTNNQCLRKIDKIGTVLCSIEGMKYPGDITTNQDDSIIVSDQNDHCIYIYNPDGSVRHKFGSSGSGKGQLKNPFGVATDGEHILVADMNNNRIQVFENDGTFVSVIESKDDPLKTPRGLAVTNDGCVYVADSGNHCVKKYRYKRVP